MESLIILSFGLGAITGLSIMSLYQKQKNSSSNKDLNHLRLKDLDQVKKTIGIITYKDIVEYSVAQCPNEPNFKKGALLRWKRKNYWDFAQVFLDGKNEIILNHAGKPYGRHFKAVDIDKELQETFGEYDLIVLE